MSKLQQLRQFCEANVRFYILSNPSVIDSAIFDGKAVGVISPCMVDDLIKVIHATSDNFPKGDGYPERQHCNVWETKTCDFLTSYWGMFYIQDVPGVCYNIGGVSVIWPDMVKHLMEEGIVPFHTGVYKAVSEKPDSWVIDQLNEFDLRKKKQQQKEKELRRFEQEMYTLLGEELAGRVLGMDLFYDYSDDIRVYKSGVAAEQELCQDLKQRGHDPKELLDKMRRLHTA